MMLPISINYQATWILNRLISMIHCLLIDNCDVDYFPLIAVGWVFCCHMELQFLATVLGQNLVAICRHYAVKMNIVECSDIILGYWTMTWKINTISEHFLCLKITILITEILSIFFLASLQNCIHSGCIICIFYLLKFKYIVHAQQKEKKKKRFAKFWQFHPSFHSMSACPGMRLENESVSLGLKTCMAFVVFKDTEHILGI